MFSTGQIVFAILFALAFIIIIVFAYRKDLKLHQKNYQGVKWVGIFFVIFLFTLFIIKYFLKN
ncbi:hypothetical protein EJ994_08295 [Maribacter sp. MJ134]|nr:hypothetical protein EJ994_08295 [Maribacter sp. MJ134]